MTCEEIAEEYRKDLKSKFFLSEPQLDLACQGFKDGYNKANEWHYCKDELPKLRVSTTVAVIAVYLNTFDNPCKIDCFFNGIDFVYWDSSCTMWVKVSEIKGSVYAWKYADELPPKESD